MAKTGKIEFRCEAETQELFNVTAEKAGMGKEDFIHAILSTFREKQEEQGGEVSEERAKVRKAFLTAEKVVGAFLELAEDKKSTAIAESTAKVAEIQEEKRSLKSDLATLRESHGALTAEHDKALAELEQALSKVEDTASLRDSWSKIEADLHAKLVRLQEIADQATEWREKTRTLEKSLAECEREKELLAQKLEMLSQQGVDDKQKLTEAEAKKDLFHAEIQNLSSSLSEAKAEAKAEAKISVRLEKELADLRQDRDDLKKILATSVATPKPKTPPKSKTTPKPKTTGEENQLDLPLK